MTASSVKGAIKGTLKGILNTAAPVFRRKSALDSASARETLLRFSPPPREPRPRTTGCWSRNAICKL